MAMEPVLLQRRSGKIEQSPRKMCVCVIMFLCQEQKELEGVMEIDPSNSQT
jgi:hypothetical protein